MEEEHVPESEYRKHSTFIALDLTAATQSQDLSHLVERLSAASQRIVVLW